VGEDQAYRDLGIAYVCVFVRARARLCASALSRAFLEKNWSVKIGLRKLRVRNESAGTCHHRVFLVCSSRCRSRGVHWYIVTRIAAGEACDAKASARQRS
jgi:hypothetical protein